MVAGTLKSTQERAQKYPDLSHASIKIQDAAGTDLGTEETFSAKAASFVDKETLARAKEQKAKLATQRSDLQSRADEYRSAKVKYDADLAAYEKALADYRSGLSSVKDDSYQPPQGHTTGNR